MALTRQPFYVDLMSSFTGGLNSYSPPQWLGKTQVAAAQNAHIKTSGVITRRPAITAAKFDWFSPNVANDVTTFLDAFVAGEGTQRKMYFFHTYYDATASLNYVVLHWFDGTNKNNVLVSASDDSSDAGSATWVRESGGTEKFYLVAANQSTMSGNITAINTQPSVSAFSDANSSPPFNARFVLSAFDRVWAAGIYGDGDNRDLLYYSAAYPNLETWDRAASYVEILDPRGEPITGIAQYKDNYLFIGKATSCYLLAIGSGNVGLDSQVVTVSTSVGVGSHHSISTVNEDLVFVDQYGNLRSLVSLLQGGGVAATRPKPLSLPIQDEVDDIDYSAIFNSRTAFYKARIWWSFKTATNGWRLFSYNLETQAWEGPHVLKNRNGYQLDVYDMVVVVGDLGTDTLGNRAANLYFVTKDADTSLGPNGSISLFKLDDTAYKDDAATAFTTTVTSRAADLGFPFQDKVWRHLEVQYKKSSAASGRMTVEVRVDSGEWTEIGALHYTDGVGDYPVQVFDLEYLPRGQVIQARLKCSDTVSSPEVLRMVVSGFAEVPNWQ